MLASFTNAQNQYSPLVDKIQEIRQLSNPIQQKEYLKIYNDISKNNATPDSIMGLVLHRLGWSYFSDSPQLAKKYTILALNYRLKQAKPNYVEIGASFYNLGLIERALFDFENSDKYFRVAHSYYQKKAHPQAIRCYLELSFNKYQLGDFEKSLLFSKIAHQLSPQNSIEYAESLNLQGMNYTELDSSSIAIRYLNETVVWYKFNNFTEYYQNAANNLANAYYANNNFQEAYKYYSIAVGNALINDNNVLQYDNLINCLIEINKLDKAEDLLNQFEKYFAKNYYYLSICYFTKAKLLSKKKHFEQANHYVSLAIRYKINQKPLENLNGLSKRHLLEYISFKDSLQGNNQQPLNLYFLADSIIDLMRYEHTEQKSKLFWRERTHALYENAIKRCYELKDYDHAFYFIEKSRAILLLDALKDLEAKNVLSAEVQKKLSLYKNKVISLEKRLEFTAKEDEKYTEYYQKWLEAKDEYRNFIAYLEKSNSAYYQHKYNASYITLVNLQDYLRKRDGTFLGYFVGEKEVYVLAVSPKKSQMLKLDKKQFSVLIPSFLADVSRELTKTEWQIFQQKAYATYQFYFEKLGVSTSKVIISPDAFFIPFEALMSSPNGNKDAYLVKKFCFSYTYSANILLRNENKPTIFEPKFLGFAPVKFLPSYKLTTLKKSDDALDIITSKYFSGLVYKNENATKKQFVNNLRKGQLVQLFTHGKADAEPIIYFYDGALKLSELYELDNINAQLVVLSACETGTGKFAQGEGIMSIARGFSYVGVPAIITTLWSINSQASYTITTLFYKYLAEGYDKDEALQKAQQEYLQDSDDSMPYFWSGMVLVGNTQKVVGNNLKYYGGIMLLLIAVMLVYFFRKKKP